MDSLFITAFYPEIFLSISILYQLVLNVRFINHSKNKYPIINIEVLWQGTFILVCLFFLQCNQKLNVYIFNFILVSDIYTRTIKIILVLVTILCFIFVWKSFMLQSLNFFEFFSLYLLSLLGILLLINCYNLISAYLVIELQALAFYILACFKRNSSFSTEAGLKYFILGSFISSLFLLGSFFIYASLGTFNMHDISLLMSFDIENSNLKSGVLIGVLLVTVSMLFKAVVAPFHFWAPDVYEGAPLASTLIFSIIPKLSILIFLIRWVSIFLDYFIYLKLLLIITGIFSVFWGAYFSIIQKRFKRFIIYSSISQVGFLIVPCSVFNCESYTSILFYLIIYLLSSILVWGSLVSFYSYHNNILKFNNKNSLNPLYIIDIISYFKLNYTWSLMLLFIFFSFAGIPPFSGFLAKFFIIFSLIFTNNLLVSIILILVSIVSTYYYLRIIKILFFDNYRSLSVSKKFLTSFSYSLNIECTILSFCIFFIFFLFFYPSLLVIVLYSITYSSTLV